MELAKEADFQETSGGSLQATGKDD